MMSQIEKYRAEWTGGHERGRSYDVSDREIQVECWILTNRLISLVAYWLTYLKQNAENTAFSCSS
jgi:hypothetical protein